MGSYYMLGYSRVVSTMYTSNVSNVNAIALIELEVHGVGFRSVLIQMLY